MSVVHFVQLVVLRSHWISSVLLHLKEGGWRDLKNFPSIDLLLMPKPQQRAAAFGVVHFWPCYPTVGFTHCSCFILGFGVGIVAIFGWLLYTSECCNIGTVGSISHIGIHRTLLSICCFQETDRFVLHVKRCCCFCTIPSLIWKVTGKFANLFRCVPSFTTWSIDSLWCRRLQWRAWQQRAISRELKWIRGYEIFNFATDWFEGQH